LRGAQGGNGGPGGGGEGAGRGAAAAECGEGRAAGRGGAQRRGGAGGAAEGLRGAAAAAGRRPWQGGGGAAGAARRVCAGGECARELRERQRDTDISGGMLSFISIQYQFNLHGQFFLIFFKTKLLMMSLKMEHCGAFHAPSYHVC